MIVIPLFVPVLLIIDTFLVNIRLFQTIPWWKNISHIPLSETFLGDNSPPLATVAVYSVTIATTSFLRLFVHTEVAKKPGSQKNYESISELVLTIVLLPVKIILSNQEENVKIF